MTRMKKRPKKAVAAPASWPTRQAAAAEMSVVLGQDFTARSFEPWVADPACRIPRGNGPIPKWVVYEWLLIKRGPGRPADASSSAIKTAQAAIFQAKADSLLGKVIPREQARDATIIAAQELRTDFVETIPGTIYALIGKKTPEEVRDQASAMGIAALNRFAKTWGTH